MGRCRFRGGIFAVLALVAGVGLAFGVAACGEGSAGGPSGALLPATGLSIRLIGFKESLVNTTNPTPRLWLFAGRPAGVNPTTYLLFESTDGINFTATGVLPTAASGNPVSPVPPLSDSLWYSISFPPNDRYFKVTAQETGSTNLISSNRVHVQVVPPPVAPAFNVTNPALFQTGVSRTTPQFIWTQASANSSYAVVLIDSNGFIHTLAETSAITYTLGAPAVNYDLGTVPLALLAPHRVTVLAIDGENYGVSATPFIDFTTAQ